MLCQQHHDGYHLGTGDIRQRLATYVSGRPDTIAYLREKLGTEATEVWLERHRHTV